MIVHIRVKLLKHVSEKYSDGKKWLTLISPHCAKMLLLLKFCIPDQAAAKIQAGFRGRKVRKEYNQKKQQANEARRREEQMAAESKMRYDEDNVQKKAEAASVIQASYRGYKVRRDYNEKKVREVEKKEREHKAAVKIQSGYKGYKVRKQYAAKHKQKDDDVVKDINDNKKVVESYDQEMKDKAAAKIQSSYKGYRTRKNYRELKAEKIVDTKQTHESSDAEKEKAAARIQAGFRGHQVRKAAANKKATAADKPEAKEAVEPEVVNNEHEAASRIQANFRGFKGRQQYAAMKKEKQKDAEIADQQKYEAATKIQASFKGYKTRKTLEEKKKEAQLPDPSSKTKPSDTDLDKAASKIQSGYRGYKARKEYKTKVIEDSDADSDVDQLPESAIARQLLKKSQFTLGSNDDVASKIQVCYRAYHFRKVFYDDFDETVLEKGELSQAKIRAAFRGFVARKQAREEKEAHKVKNVRTMAATTIQAHYRGYKVRNTQIYHTKHVNRLQAAFRAHITRKLNRIQTKSLTKVLAIEGGDYYATQIQCLCRGYMTRNSLTGHTARPPVKSAQSLQGPTESNENISYWEDSNIKMYSDKTLRLAATRIQSAYHMYVVRRKYGLIRKKLKYSQNQAAIKIQAHYKGYLVRKGLENEQRVREEKDVDKKSSSAEDLHKTVKDDREFVSKREGEKLETVKGDREFTHKSEIEQGENGDTQENESFVTKEVSQSRPSTGRRSRGSKQKALDDEKTEAKHSCSRPSTGRKSRGSSKRTSSAKSRTSSGRKRNHAGKVKVENGVKNESDKNDEKGYHMGEIGKEGTLDSVETLQTISTLLSKDNEKSSSGEIEKEGESPREVEDDADELDVMKKNANAVSQVQAAFRAYKLRREVSELLSGGGELMDIKKVDRAVSALKKDFKLRSAKVRRLASYQFSKGSPKNKPILDSEDMQDVARLFAAQTVQDAFRSYHYRKVHTGSVDNTNDMNLHVSSKDNGVELVRPMNDQTQTENKKCGNGLMVNRTEQALKIEAAFRGYRTRQIEKRLKADCEHTSYLDKAEPGQEIRKEDDDEKDKKENAKLLIRAAFRGFHVRRRVKTEKRRQLSAAKIEAAFRGYITRKTERNIQKKTELKRCSSEKGRYHVKMFSKVINNRATQLQAAVASYQTRKVLISLTRMVEQDQDDDTSVSGKNLERMGSLTETDDFKLRHKSIAKIQALEAERNEAEFERELSITTGQNESKGLQGSVSENPKLPFIQLHTKQISLRPKSGILMHTRNLDDIGGKSKTQPEMRHGNQQSGSNEKLHGIEVFIKKKTAATCIQSFAKGFLMRHVCRDQIKKSSKETEKRSSSRKSERSSSKVSFTHSDTDEKSKPIKVSDEIRARTASIKLEAERRKLIAQRVEKKKAAEALEAAQSVNREAEASLRIENSEPDKKVKSSKHLTPIMSERNVEESDLKQRENSAAIKIQKVFRGYIVRKKQRNQLQGTAKLEEEYEEWKQSRIQAAIAIQSSWRGYMVRRELQKEQEDHENMAQDTLWSRESTPGMLIINIGRTKSEIERANQKYDNGSMIQMVVRASKIRRKVQVKMAIRRTQKAGVADQLHAVVRGFQKRLERRRQISAVNVQSIMKGFIERVRMQHRVQLKEEAQQKAATHIQAVYRACIKRADNAAIKEAKRKLAEANQAAVFIQSAYRGHSVREELGYRKEELQKEATVKIVAGMLGRKARVKMIEKKKAAVRLVAGYRSYNRRRELRLYKEKLEREKVAATRMQSAFKSYRRRVKRRLYVEKMEREKVAATKLQAGFRSYRTRCEMRKYKEKMARQYKAASVIQSSARGKLRRIEFQLLKELNFKKEEASVKIQSIFRGYRDRMSVKKLRHVVEVNKAAKDIIELLIDRSVDYLTRRSESAERIQATVKGHMTRSSMDEERLIRNQQRNYCASSIQAVVRAEQGRALNEQMRVLAHKNASATKIQSLYRGYSTRKELARERSIIADIEPPFISARTRSGRLLALSLDGVLMKNARAMILFHKKASELQAAFRAQRVRQEVHERLFMKHKIAEMTPRRDKTFKNPSREDKAAVLIQKIWRGYSDRKAYKMLLTSKRKIWNASASIIHASVIGYKRRKEERQRRERLKRESVEEIANERTEAADIISYAYRALKRRREKIALRVEM